MSVVDGEWVVGGRSGLRGCNCPVAILPRLIHRDAHPDVDIEVPSAIAQVLSVGIACPN